MKYSDEEVLKAARVLLPDYAKYELTVSVSENLIADTDEDRYYYYIYKKGKNKEIGTFSNSHIRKALASLAKVFGYCRISKPQQSIDRQIQNIKAEYPNAVIVEEAYTDPQMDRPEWDKLYKIVKTGDIIVFESVSRMSRNANEGIETYFRLYENGVQLIFLREHYIDTEVYAEILRDKIELQGTNKVELSKVLNSCFRKLAERQIRIAFEQAEKEHTVLRQQKLGRK